MLRKLILLGALAWTGWSCGAEMLHVLTHPPADGRTGAPPIFWRFGAPEVTELARSLSALDDRLPAGSVVAVTSPPLPQSGGFFLSMWCAYYLPHHDVVRLELPASRAIAQYVFAWHTTLDHPRLARLERGPAGTLYRVLAP